jgi:histidine triad (HIT) family protein
MRPTLFTKIINGEIPSSMVAKGEGWFAFLDIFPRRSGHTLVVPIEQQTHLVQLSRESRSALIEGVVEVQRRLSEEFDTSDFSIVIHDGADAGQEVPHVHVHVIPRTMNDGGGGLNSMWPVTSIDAEPDFTTLNELAGRLSKN